MSKKELENKTEELIKRYAEYTGYENATTEEYQGVASFYLLPNGKFLNCKVENGYRRDDHSLIFKVINEIEYYDFKAIHDIFRVIRIVPECNIVLVKKGQRILAKQQKAIDELGFKIEKY